MCGLTLTAFTPPKCADSLNCFDCTNPSIWYSIYSMRDWAETILPPGVTCAQALSDLRMLAPWFVSVN